MRVQQTQDLFGSRLTTEVVFTAQERSVLRRAAAVASQARARARAEAGEDFELHGIDTLLAEVEHGATELADLGSIEVA